MEKILLHACCAPCTTYPIKKLISEGYRPVVFFYNPNIYPFKEHEKRRLELKNYCKKIDIEYIESPYEIKEFYKRIKGFEKEKEKGKRCSICFNLRLEKTAKTAKENGINFFTTTLSVSPHKNSNQIFEQGRIIAKNFQLNFLEFDFKKKDGFLKTNKN